MITIKKEQQKSVKRRRKKSSSRKKSYTLKGSRNKGKKKLRNELKLMAVSFLIAMSITVISIFLTFSFVRMEGYSMMPEVKNKDVVIVNRLINLKRFDLIYMKIPNTSKGKTIRRIIGVPGDEIVYIDDELFINGQGKSERYLSKRKKELIDSTLTADFSLFDLTKVKKVPPDMYFVLGDNRQSSADSRDYGFVASSQVIGRVETRISPLDKIKNY